MKKRNINGTGAHLTIEGVNAQLSTFTGSGAHYVIKWRLTVAEAQCAMAKLGDFIAQQFTEEQSFQRRVRQRIAEAYHRVDAAIERKEPKP